MFKKLTIFKKKIMNKNKILLILLTVLGLSFAFSACVKHNYDNPPTNCNDADTIEITMSIDELKSILGSNDTLQLEDSVVIAGFVTSSDQFGNQYKELTIQDTSGAIVIQLDEYDLFTKYPIGQKVIVRCGDLYLGKDYDYIKLGGIYLDGGQRTFGRIVGEDVIENHIIRTCENMPIEPKIVLITDLNDDMLYELVKIEVVQFNDADYNKTWADGINQTSENRILTDSAGHTLIVRTSGYASFAKDSLPKGSGYIIGLVGKRLITKGQWIYYRTSW